jgi:hypothetical protein
MPSVLEWYLCPLWASGRSGFLFDAVRGGVPRGHSDPAPAVLSKRSSPYDLTVVRKRLSCPSSKRRDGQDASPPVTQQTAQEPEVHFHLACLFLVKGHPVYLQGMPLSIGVDNLNYPPNRDHCPCQDESLCLPILDLFTGVLQT